MMLPERWQKVIDQYGQHYRIKLFSYLEEIVFDFLKKIRNYLVVNPIYFIEVRYFTRYRTLSIG